MSFYREQKDMVIVKIKANPGKQASRIAGAANDELCIDIKAQPEKGKANKEIIRFLSKEFSLSKSEIEITAGLTGRHKTVMMPASALPKLKSFEDE